MKHINVRENPAKLDRIEQNEVSQKKHTCHRNENSQCNRFCRGVIRIKNYMKNDKTAEKQHYEKDYIV